MANIAKILKDEISRIAKKEIRLHTTSLKQENIKLRKEVSQLRKALSQLEKSEKRLARKVAPVVEKEEAAKEEESAKVNIRPTSKTVRKLRTKFGISQADFATLLGVSMQSIANWEGKDGRINMRSKALEQFASIMPMGAKEARKKLEEIKGAAPTKARKSRETKKKAQAKPIKKAAKKTRGRPKKSASKA